MFATSLTVPSLKQHQNIAKKKNALTSKVYLIRKSTKCSWR